MGSVLTVKLARYAIVGIATLVVYLGIGAIMQVAGLSVEVLAFFSFIAAITVNYLMQKFWVFSDHRSIIESLPKYLVMITIGCIINMATLILLTDRFSLILAQSMAIILIIISNAFFSFFWTFRQKSKLET